MQQLKTSFYALKRHFERILIFCLLSTILLTSAISWGKLLSENDHPTGFSNTSKTTQAVKNKVMLFSGLMLIVAEYFQTED